MDPSMTSSGELPAVQAAASPVTGEAPLSERETLTSFEQEILTSLRRIVRAVSLYSRQLLIRYDLTAPQLTCLRHLVRHGSRGAGELAAGISLSQPTVTGILDRLERKGLVERRRSAADRRRVAVALTPAGRELATSVPMPLQERFARGLARLPESRRQHIDSALKEVVELMEATRVDAAPVLAGEPSMSEEPEEGATAAGDPERGAGR
jgi:DNA-binding MarR family transcriptional regulator